MIRARQGSSKEAMDTVSSLYNDGYAASDIIQTLFRVTRTMDLPEPLKLEFIREIGFTHMRISEGLNSQLQLLGCMGRLSLIANSASGSNSK